jgi:hypothetical protein
LPTNSTPIELSLSICWNVDELSMNLLSLRLPSRRWFGTANSATAQYTVPSVSTQMVVPRRLGRCICATALRKAEPAAPSL